MGKYRVRRENLRALVKGCRSIIKNKHWWSDPSSDSYCPYVNELASHGFFPETWSWSEDHENFTGMCGVWGYVYVTPGNKIKTRVSSLDTIYGSFGELMEDFKSHQVPLIFKDKEMEIYLNIPWSKNNSRKSTPTELHFSVILKVQSSASVVLSAISSISTYLTDHHKAKRLYSGLLSHNNKSAFNSWRIREDILQSFWDYAKGGITHVYKANGKPWDIYDLDSSFIKIELSDEDLNEQKRIYEEMSYDFKIACGVAGLKNIEASFKNRSKGK